MGHSTEPFPHLGSLTLAVLSDHRNPETSTVNAAGRGCRSAETESYISLIFVTDLSLCELL